MLQAQADAEDAARYRWLRELGAVRCEVIRPFIDPGVPSYDPKMLDQAIDRARGFV
jgi:hypothetical protein